MGAATNRAILLVVAGVTGCDGQVVVGASDHPAKNDDPDRAPSHPAQATGGGRPEPRTGTGGADESASAAGGVAGHGAVTGSGGQAGSGGGGMGAGGSPEPTCTMGTWSSPEPSCGIPSEPPVGSPGRWPDSATTSCLVQLWSPLSSTCPLAGETYDNQDGNHCIFGQSFATTSAIATDMVTGLVWQRVTSAEMDYESAVAYCENLTSESLDDWRMPSRLELSSVVDYGRISPAFDPNVFTVPTASTPSDGKQLWTGTAGSMFAPGAQAG